MWNWLSKVWSALKPDQATEESYIRMSMELDGYTDYEIALEIRRIRQAELDKAVAEEEQTLKEMQGYSDFDIQMGIDHLHNPPN